MKKYKYKEWDINMHTGMSFNERTYIDLNENLITGILEGFYGYTNVTSDKRNCQYVENGKVKTNQECIVYGCTNKKYEGNFVGDMCVPCFNMITNGTPEQPSNNFIHQLYKRKKL